MKFLNFILIICAIIGIWKSSNDVHFFGWVLVLLIVSAETRIMLDIKKIKTHIGVKDD